MEENAYLTENCYNKNFQEKFKEIMSLILNLTNEMTTKKKKHKKLNKFSGLDNKLWKRERQSDTYLSKMSV